MGVGDHKVKLPPTRRKQSGAAPRISDTHFGASNEVKPSKIPPDHLSGAS